MTTINGTEIAASEILAWLKRNAAAADQCDVIGLRIQTGAEAKRTKPGSMLRPSSAWIDGTKTRRKLSGTAVFELPRLAVSRMTESDLQPILNAMGRGYNLTCEGDRLVLVGGKSADDAGMPERFAVCIAAAQLLDVF